MEFILGLIGVSIMVRDIVKIRKKIGPDDYSDLDAWGNFGDTCQDAHDRKPKAPRQTPAEPKT